MKLQKVARSQKCDCRQLFHLSITWLIMNCRFEKKWLKHGYDDRKQILKHFEKQILSEKMKNALLAVHTCKYETLPTKPSAKDLAFVNGPVMYG